MTEHQAAAEGGASPTKPASGPDSHDGSDTGTHDGRSSDGESADPLTDTGSDANGDPDGAGDGPGVTVAGEAVPELGTVLVTGGAGFIGGHLVDALATCNDVRVLDTFETGRRDRLPDDVVAIEGDVRDGVLLAEAASGVDVIVHLAAQVSVEDSLADPRGSSETNVSATLDVLECARREEARVVLASSAAIYGDPDAVPIEESAPKRPASPYGVDKLAADNYARVFGDCYDVPVVPLRYFNVYGPGANAGVIQAFAERAVAGEPLVVHGDGEQTRDFVHVDDVVAATLAASGTATTGRAYNVGTGERISIAELAELVAARAPTDVPIEYAPPRPGDVEHSQAAIDRARSELGFEPRVPLAAGVESTIEAVRAERATLEHSST